jgi:hypothetical protein
MSLAVITPLNMGRIEKTDIKSQNKETMCNVYNAFKYIFLKKLLENYMPYDLN